MLCKSVEFVGNVFTHQDNNGSAGSYNNTRDVAEKKIKNHAIRTR